MKKLRLLITSKCDRNCQGCCNKELDLKKLPFCTSFRQYDEILLTGGEPLLYPNLTMDIISQIRKSNPTAKVIVYTANTKSFYTPVIADLSDGLTITLHTKADVTPFMIFDKYLSKKIKKGQKSLRLNVFKEVGKIITSDLWDIKENIEWIENCQLPDDEIFMRL